LVVFALTFAAQNLVRDFLNGFLVLLEDQYVVGDYVRIGEWAGMVEHMTLRIVQIRDASGNLVTIPYGTTNAVVNASRYWSRIDYQIAIASDADAGKALEVMRETLERLTRDPQWREAIVDPLEWAGVESVGSGGLLLRACVRTAPLRQFELRREINARVLAAFREAGIAFGVSPDGVVK
jgi:small conductance mechanosensitive channel